MTVHKTQGSQFKRVIIALTQSNLIDQSWLYTAVTRAEVTVELVGSSALFKRAIQRKSASYIRQTYLHQLLAAEHEGDRAEATVAV
jgi:exodeoxyribonuclease V alpha subunit